MGTNFNYPVNPESSWPEGLTAAGIPYGAARAIVSRCVDRKQCLFKVFSEYGREDLIQIGLMGVLADWKKWNPAKAKINTFLYKVAWSDIRDVYRGRFRRSKYEAEVAIGNSKALAWDIDEHGVGEEPEGIRWVEALEAIWEAHCLDRHDGGVGFIDRYASILAIDPSGGIIPNTGGLDIADYDKLMGHVETILRRDHYQVGGDGGEIEPDDQIHEWLDRVYLACSEYALRRKLGSRLGRRWFSQASKVAAGLLMMRMKLSTRGAEELVKKTPQLQRVLRLRHIPNHRWWVYARSAVPNSIGVALAAA